MMAIKFSINRRFRSWISSLGLGLLISLWLALPGVSAERIYANFGPLERFVSVDALVNYAQTGELGQELEWIQRFLDPEQLEQLRNGLTLSADIDVVTVSQFLYTAQGEGILEWLGGLIQTAGRQNGALAIRGAVIQATADREGGLTLLNFLKHFPTNGVRVDLQALVGITWVAIAEINQTNQITAQLFEQAAKAIDETPRDFTLAEAGADRWEIYPFEKTTLPTDLYLPETKNAPLVVLSHGLGGNRETLAYLAEHLASHGFAAAVVEHPGSSEAQLEALLSGKASEAIEPEEMTHRPTDIQAFLDELEAAAQADPTLRNQLNFNQVGVLGQSMGAYTTLALAGATVDLETLDESCPPEVAQLNLSLLLQCLVPSLPQPLPTLQDSRVKVAIALNPLDSAVFGPTGMANIQIPTLIVSGSADTVTPALAEQIRPFTWMTSPNRYLLLMEGGTHFSAIHDPQAAEAPMTLPERIIGPDPELAQRYIKAISLAFLKTHLTEDVTYRQYLDPSYTAALSQPEIPITLLRELTLEE